MGSLHSPPRGDFHATLGEAEPGVYRAEYSGELNPDHPGERELPDFHLGTSRADVKVWVEQMARGLGCQPRRVAFAHGASAGRAPVAPPPFHLRSRMRTPT